MVMLVGSLLNGSPVRYSSKYQEDQATSIIEWQCSEKSHHRLTTFQLALLHSTLSWLKEDYNHLSIIIYQCKEVAILVDELT